MHTIPPNHNVNLNALSIWVKFTRKDIPTKYCHFIPSNFEHSILENYKLAGRIFFFPVLVLDFATWGCFVKNH